MARATVRNVDGRWRPGTAVRARVTVSERQAALIRSHEGAAKRGKRHRRIRAIWRHLHCETGSLGERDASRNAEVLEGLKAGEEIVVEQSYVIKADLEKASAAYDD